ncbi:9759_t:CDS:2 [Diversispora eburnea]|uniref:9759_t:CDS:1 n=1 Tax=Diversispora eburnea TaxID=1213867 RepID=A0A9N8WBN4_9GLOM|nr:9759_t:CDS:2 [Diversispora eburnea]
MEYYPQRVGGLFENEMEHNVRIKKLFDELDYDKKGVLTRENIQKGLKRLGNHPSRNKYAAELLQKIDTTSDGVIDLKEFKAFVEEKEKELWKLFIEIDNSHDMRLQPEELEIALKKSGINCTKPEIKKFIKTIDKDGNGVIDFAEWRDFLLFLPRDITIFEIFEYSKMLAQVSIDGEVTIPPTDLKYLAAGAIAGAISRTATAPLDRLTNLSIVFKRLYNGGILNFFRGNGLNVAKIAPESAIKFFAYEKSKAIVAQLMKTDDIGSIGMSGRFLSGGLGGVVSQFAIYPLETWKTRVMKMWRTQGFKSFYKGLVPSLVGVFPYAAVDMSVYETLKLSYIKRKAIRSGGREIEHPSSWVSLGCGMISGSIAQGTPGHPQRYTGAIDVIRKTYTNEGIRGFYKGLIPALSKVIPAAAITYVVYEKIENIVDFSSFPYKSTQADCKARKWEKEHVISKFLTNQHLWDCL